MATSTGRLGLIKPTGSEAALVSQINANMDSIDSAVGFKVCTSTTRPTSPYPGESIYESDTGHHGFWTGGTWYMTGTFVQTSFGTGWALTSALSLKGYAGMGDVIINFDVSRAAGIAGQPIAFDVAPQYRPDGVEVIGPAWSTGGGSPKVAVVSMNAAGVVSASDVGAGTTRFMGSLVYKRKAV